MLMAETMAGTQRTRNPKIIIAASYYAVYWFLMGTAFLFAVWPDDAGAQIVVVPSLTQNPLLLPSITVSEEYNDNVFLNRYNKIDDYITRVMPTFTLDYQTSLWYWHLGLTYDYRYYAKGTKKGDNTYLVDLKNHTELIHNFFFIDMTDRYNRTSLSAATDFTLQSLFVNQTDQNIFTFNPYITHKSESHFTPILGYKYVNTWYKNPAANDAVDQIGYAEMITTLSSTMTFTTGVRYTHNVNRVQNYDRTDVYAGPTYTYAPNSLVFVLIGETFLTFQFQKPVNRTIWDAGVIHSYSTIELAFHTKSDYIYDPTFTLRRWDMYLASLKKVTPRTSFGVQASLNDYGDAATNRLQQTNYELRGTLDHAISPTLRLLMDETIQRIEDHQASTITSLWLSHVTLQRQVTTDLILNLEYRYTHSYSHDNYLNNYYNNRVIVGLTKLF